MRCSCQRLAYGDVGPVVCGNTSTGEDGLCGHCRNGCNTALIDMRTLGRFHVKVNPNAEWAEVKIG